MYTMQKPGTEAIRTKIQLSKPKREITKITKCQNKKRTYDQPSEQHFPKRWPLSNLNRTKNSMNTHKLKRHRNSDTKIGNREPQQNKSSVSTWRISNKQTHSHLLCIRNI